MSLASSILAGLRILTQYVRISGALILPQNPKETTGTPGVGALTISKSFDSPVPTLEMSVNRIPTRFTRGQPVTVDLGYNNFTKRRFTGTLQSRNRRIATATMTSVGSLWLAMRTVDSPEVVVTGMTIKEALENRLDFCGITNYAVDASLDYELGTAVEAKLPAGPIADQIAMLMDIRDAQAYELGSGQIIVRPIDFQPAPTAFKSYDSENNATARILDGSDRDDPEYFRDKITVTGASIPDGDPEDPDTVFEALTFTATLLGSNLQQPPAPEGAFSTAILSQPLIDTAAELANYATRKLTRFARVPRYVTIELPGDPDIELGQTLGFSLPLLDMSGRWFVYGLEDSVDNSPQSEANEVPGYRQFLTLRGGDEAGGTVAINPIAAFTYAVLLQAIGDDIYAIITLDASTSFDPDGEIVSWDWTGDVTGSGQVFTTAVLASSATELEVTLTVEDSDGLTAVRTQTISIESTGFFVTQPAVYCAAEEWLFATPDGGQTFNDQEMFEATAVDVKPSDGSSAGVAVYGFGDGRLGRTTDFVASVPIVVKAATGSRINDVWWDKNVLTRVWACDTDGRLYRSDDDGQTWVTHRNFGGTYPLWRIATPIPGGVWVFGGRADQPSTLVQYEAIVGSGNWQSVPVAGELAAALSGASSAITVAAAASRVANELYIIFKGGELSGGNIFWTPAVFDGNAWKQGTGLDGGLDEGRVIMPDFGPGVAYAMFDNRDVWYIDTSSGTPVCTNGADFLPADYTPTHGLWEGEFLGGISGVHLIAAEHTSGTGAIFKSLDAMQNADFFRPISGISTMPTFAQPVMLAIGVGGTPAIAGEIGLLARGEDFWRYAFTANAWNLIADGIPSTDNADTLRSFSYGGTPVLFFISRLNASANDPGTLMRSDDGGITWAAVLSVDPAPGGDLLSYGVVDFDIGPDGTVYALIAVEGLGADDDDSNDTFPMTVKYSTDQGLTFDDLYVDTGFDNGTPTITNATIRGEHIAINEAGNVILIATAGISACPNAVVGIKSGATWNFTQEDWPIPRDATLGNLDQLRAGASGRFLYLVTDSDALYYSDDNGETWTLASGFAGSNGRQLGWRRPNWFNRNVMCVDGILYVTEDNGATWTQIATDLGTPEAVDYNAALDVIFVADANLDDVSIVENPFGSPAVTNIASSLGASLSDGHDWIGAFVQ